MDYGRAVWTLPPAGIKVWLDWVFVWPMAPQHNIIASILSQNRIGCAHMDQWNLLRLKCGEHNIIRVHIDGRIDIGHASNGQKVGSR